MDAALKVFVPLAEKINECASFRQRLCCNFEEGACKPDWDESHIEVVKARRM